MADKKIRLLVKAEVQKAVNNLNKLEKKTDKTKRSASELTSTFQGLFGAAVLGGAARSVVQTASNFESLQVRLVALKGSTEEGAKAFNQFTKIAATTPFQVQNVVEAGATLEAFGVSSEDSLKSIADLAAFMGTDIVDASAAFGRAFAGGAGAADILRERGILQLIKDSEGIEDLSKLTLPEFRAALERAMTDPDGKIAGATDLLAATFSGKVSNMQDAIDQLQNAIGGRMLGGLGDFALGVRDAATSMTDFVSNLSEEQIGNMEDFVKTLAIMAGGFGAVQISIMVSNAALGLFAKRIAIFAVAFEALNTVVKNMSLVRQKILEIRLSLAEFDLAVEKRFPNLVFGTEEENQERVNSIREKLAETVAQNENITFEKGMFTKILLGEDGSMEEVMEDVDKVIEKQKELADTAKASVKGTEDGNKKKADSNKKTLEQSLTGMAEEGKITKSSAISTIKAKAKESSASYISSIFKGVPFPANIVLAGLASAVIDKLFEPLTQFQTGGSFVTNKRTTLPIGGGIVVGDNASAMERVDITPLPAAPNTNDRNIVINISAPLVDETVVDQIIPAIRRAEKLGL